MAKIKSKGSSSFIGKTVVSVKEIEKKGVYSKRQGKHIDVVEHKGSVELSNGNFLTLKVSKTSDAKYKESGKSYWIEVAEFSSNGSNQR